LRATGLDSRAVPAPQHQADLAARYALGGRAVEQHMTDVIQRRYIARDMQESSRNEKRFGLS
jgi:hypothetical protein